MRKITKLVIGVSLLGGVFIGGVAVGKATKEPKFIAKEELKWEDLGGPKIAAITGDTKKGPYLGLLSLPGGAGGFTSPLHSHSGDYEAVQITGTSTHWIKGEDGTKAKKMTPGSYWSFPGKVEHVSQCEKGAECLVLVMQKTKFDFVPGKEDKKPADAKPADKKPADAKPADPKPPAK